MTSETPSSARQVTVCIPVYNGAAFVRETLDSVLAQTHREVAVRVSVDASTDDSAALCREYERDPRVEVTMQPARLGWIANTNALIERVRTPYFCIMPHDDVIAPTYLERLLERLEARPHAVLAFSAISWFGDRQSPGKRRPKAVHGGTAAQRLAAYLRTERGAPGFRGLVAQSRLSRLHLLADAGGHSDALWVFGLAVEGDLEEVNEPLYRKRAHAASVTALGSAVREPNDATRARDWLIRCANFGRIALNVASTADERALVLGALQDRLLQRNVGFPASQWARQLTLDNRRRLCGELGARIGAELDLDRLSDDRGGRSAIKDGRALLGRAYMRVRPKATARR